MSSQHPSKLPISKPPGPEWVYGECHGGPLDSQYFSVPEGCMEGQVVRWHEGCYMIGPYLDCKSKVRSLEYYGEADD